ncbi:MAG: hypothetical protein A3E36_01100 [Candidatus Andersenbacteria bacterium RIFCSPHIGHO2_12_FULL_45_11b]|uniref:Uncharacterized protein n=1 Tax=Candidatus Andersenbacteria bacterium RIFCSPHIGHO2_12_FULL_45_11b TaxID=1797282 RepID=A0A1G1XB13_9BACT|nr:MAG: hypothetical protein A3E36_01100 [Candidatus Andersenbacteria bacterium RIFCSPHIGHO2_12_FULL_45_11b]
MQINSKKFIFSFVALTAIFLCVIAVPEAYAAGSLGGGSGIKNPLSGGADQTIKDVLVLIIKWMLGLVGFLALIALIIGGGRMVIDFGNEEQVKKAKTTILWAVIGLAVVILSYAILNIVATEILQSGGGTTQDPGYIYDN